MHCISESLYEVRVGLVLGQQKGQMNASILAKFANLKNMQGFILCGCTEKSNTALQVCEFFFQF